MAARRVTRSAIEWASITERMPKGSEDNLRALKAKTDQLVSKIQLMPEALPKINWEQYRKIVPQTNVVNAFEKQYASLTIPYPKDKANWQAKLDTEEREALEQSKVVRKAYQELIEDLKDDLKAIGELPPTNEMTLEMWNAYFPGSGFDKNRPLFYPGDAEAQPNEQIRNRKYIPEIHVSEGH